MLALSSLGPVFYLSIPMNMIGFSAFTSDQSISATQLAEMVPAEQADGSMSDEQVAN